MRIQEEDVDLSQPKTLKVRIPTKLHLQLHSVKILTGKNISDTVERALQTYFGDQLNGDEEAEVLEGDAG